MVRPASRPIPENYPALTPHLWFPGTCRAAIGVYRRVFKATEAEPLVATPDGKRVLHAVLRFGNARLMLADAWPMAWEAGPRAGVSASLWLYVEECDTVFDRAAAAGFEIMMPPADAFWGDRFAKVKDPFGHVWSVATHRWDLTPDELEEARAAWLATL